MRDLKRYGQGNETGWLRDILCLAILLAVPFLQYLGTLPLIDPDEGRYAEIPREMLERGDFITPTLNYVLYFEKPPLLYWLNAASFKLFGLTEAAARLPSALCGLSTVLATYVIARRLYDRRTAIISAMILGTSAGFVIQSRIVLTDMLLTFCLTAALGSFIVAAQREGRRSNPALWYLFYLFCALATLAKGLIGIVFPVGIIGCYLFLSGRWRLLREMRPATGLLLFLAVAAPWFVAVSLKHPAFPHFFFIHEHLQRFSSTVHHRQQPFWFFVPVLIGAMLPWSFFIPGALGRAWRDRRHDEGRAGLYLLIWAAVIFLFFSKSNSKLVPYILPIFPPLAILVAQRFSGLLDGRCREIKPASIMLGLVFMILGGAALALAHLPDVARHLAAHFPDLRDPLRQFSDNLPALSPGGTMAIAVLFLLQGGVALISAGVNLPRMLALLCVCSLLLECLTPHLVMPAIAASESPRDLALTARSLAGPDTLLITSGPMQAVSWYTRRRVVVAGKRDELEFGSRQGDQSEWFPDMDRFLKLWRGERHLLVFLKKSELETLASSFAPPPRIVAESGRFVLISNR